MNLEELFSKRICNEIDHEILMELLIAANVDEKTIDETSKRFWEGEQAKFDRQLGVIKNEDIHKPKEEN